MPTTIFRKHFHVTARGFYRASVIDAHGGTVSSTDWQPNLILNSGLDKIAHMPWAQVFQFCVAGNRVAPTAPAVTDTALEQTYSINSFWLTGAGNCGHTVSGNVLRLYRTFDFYRFSTGVQITELGFKESPGTPILFSRVVLSQPQKVSPGAFLRVNYELQITLNPGAAQSPNPVPTIGGWTTGATDSESLQMIGMCGINSTTNVAEAVDSSGFCNEAFAPGTQSFGPGYGFVNRWRNGTAVNYIGGSGSPFQYIGPLYGYAARYKNPHNYIQAKMQTSDGGFATSAGVYTNYFNRTFHTSMATYHGYTAGFPAEETDGDISSLIISPGNNQTLPVSVSLVSHLWDPVVKFNSDSSIYHACNSYFVDPALNDASKSYVTFPNNVAQPALTGPYWRDWVVPGSSCFLSTSGTAPTTFGSTVDRSTGETQYELPLRLEPYTPGSFTRTKYCVFDTFVANAGWRSVGIGPTSPELTPSLMNDAATSNGYVYVFNGTNTKANTHQLRIAFVYTWARA